MKKKIGAILLAVALVVGLSIPMAIAPAVASPSYIETIYLADTLSLTANDGTTIYTVELVDGTPNKANLTYFCGMPDGARYDTVAALACSPDGGTLYVIDRDTSWLAAYDIATMTWTEVGATGLGNCVQLVCSGDGTLYAASNNTDSLYTVNTSDASTTLLGVIKEGGTTTVNVQGADIVFGVDDSEPPNEILYLWTDGGTASKRGLYTLSLPPSGGVVTATRLGGTSPPQYTGLAIRAGGAGDLIGSNTGDDDIDQLSRTDGSVVKSYEMYLGGSPYSYEWGDMTIGELAVEEEKCGDLIAGQHIDVGDIIVSNDGTTIYVAYEITEPDWVITATHLYVGKTDPNADANGNPLTSAPGQFPYDDDDATSVTDTEVTYEIPLDDIDGYHMQLNKKGNPTGVMVADGDPGVESCNDVYIAAQAEVQRIGEVCIDFEDYNEKDEVSTVSTDNGPVNFYMTSRTPLESLSVGQTADLTPITDSYPIVAEPDTSPPYDKIVAFTVVDTGNPYRDDWVKDDGGTGAGGMTLTDPQDLTQTNPLLYHAYAADKAIVIDVSGIEAVQALGLAAIDLDWTEVWYFMYFNADNELVQITQVGPPTSQTGDGVAFAVDYANPVSKVAIWGGMNLGQEDRVGYAIDNVCVTSIVQEETAWGWCETNGGEFPGANWATYITYHVK